MKKERPCETCEIKKWYMRKLGWYVAGEDCFYECEAYEKWKEAENND